VRYDPGDLEIEVERFQRDAAGGDERRVFKAWTAGGEADDAPRRIEGNEYTFNSTDLRLMSSASANAGTAIALEMCPLPPVGGVPLKCCATRCSCFC